jgi:hypothetical protein
VNVNHSRFSLALSFSLLQARPCGVRVGLRAVRPLDGDRHVGAVCRQLPVPDYPWPAGTVNSLRTEDDGRPAWRISSSEFGQAGPIPSFSSSTHSQDGPLFSFPGPRPPR